MDKSKALIAGNICVANGLQCEKCKLIRPYELSTCPCSEPRVEIQERVDGIYANGIKIWPNLNKPCTI